MILHIHSDASFLSEPGAKRRAVRYNSLSTASADSKKANPKQTPLNEPVHVKCTNMRNVLAGATEAEIGSLFFNCQRGAATHIALIDMGHDQPPTPAVKDTATGDGFANNNIRQRRSRSINMRYYWVRDRVRQGQVLVYWMAGEQIIAGYFTKHHPTSHHQ